MAKVNSLAVAKLARVSPATVSLVLGDRRDIAIPETTRQRVRDAATELGYRPNLLARNLLRGRTQTIGIIAPRMDSTFCGQIVQGIQEACATSDYRVLLAHTMHDPAVEARQVDLLLDHQVDGIISVADECTLHELPIRVEHMLKRSVPCVIVDDHSLANRVDCLVSDDVAGTRMVMEHLIGLGHRRIAHLSGGTLASSGRVRLETYRSALNRMGIPIDPRLVVGRSFDKSEVAPAMHSLLDLPYPPTAVFAANDELAAEARRVLAQRGLRVPEEIALVGYADFELSYYLELTTVHQDALNMGRRAAERLLQRIAKPHLPPEVLLTPTCLVVRKTCGATTQHQPIS